MRVPFQVNSNGRDLLGILHIANKQQDTPIVIIMCYGLNGNRVEQHRMSVKLGELCEENSVNFVRFDYANVGISEGEFFFSTLSERIKNVVDIYRFVSGCFNRRLAVFLIGFSDGAKIAIQAKEQIDEMKGIMCWNPIINIPHPMDSNSEAAKEKGKLRIHKKYKKPYKQLFGVCLNTIIMKEIGCDNSVDKLDDNVHKLFVFGENDRFTKGIRAYVENMNFHNNRIVIISNAGHLFGSTVCEQQVNQITLKWIQECANDNW